MLFEGKYGKVFDLCINVSEELKCKVNDLIKFIPNQLKENLENDKKISIKNEKFKAACKKYKAEKAHVLLFKYEKEKYAEDELMSLEISVTAIDEKWLNRLPKYNEANKGVYNYNYILSIEYSANHKSYEYEVEIRRLGMNDYCLVTNFSSSMEHEAVELGKLDITKAELLSKTNTKGR